MYKNVLILNQFSHGWLKHIWYCTNPLVFWGDHRVKLVYYTWFCSENDNEVLVTAQKKLLGCSVLPTERIPQLKWSRPRSKVTSWRPAGNRIVIATVGRIKQPATHKQLVRVPPSDEWENSFVTRESCLVWPQHTTNTLKVGRLCSHKPNTFTLIWIVVVLVQLGSILYFTFLWNVRIISWEKDLLQPTFITFLPSHVVSTNVVRWSCIFIVSFGSNILGDSPQACQRFLELWLTHLDITGVSESGL